MSRPASRITPEREALLRFFARGRNTQPALRKHFDIYSALATARIGNAISACELRRVLPTRPGASMTPAVYEITDKGRAALHAIDHPADPANEPPPAKPAKSLKAGAMQTPRELAVGLDADRRNEKSQALYSRELLEKLVKATPRGQMPHAPRGAPWHQSVKAAPRIPTATSRDPCPRCGTRGDLGCRHREAAMLPVDHFIAPLDGREQSAGRTGHHLRKLPSSAGASHG